MPPALPWLLLVVAAAAAFKLSLWYVWSRKLYARHGARHSFGSLFNRFVGGRIQIGGKPLWYRKHHMDEALWNDFRPLQWWNLITSLVLIMVLFFAFSMVIGHFRS
jgi:hypothetical protein